MVLPILFVGSMTVLLNGFPIQAYQDFLDSFLGGALRSIILVIQTSTVGVLAVYMTIAVCISYMNQTMEGGRTVSKFGGILGGLTGFFILVGFFNILFFLKKKAEYYHYLQSYISLISFNEKKNIFNNINRNESNNIKDHLIF